MEWLSQNWLWIIFLIGVFLLMRRSGMGCGMGLERATHDQAPGDGAHREPPSNAKDPVSGQALDPDSAVTSVYRGRVYYFASRENRDRFEAEPARYAAAPGGEEQHAHRRHAGCC